MVIILLAVAYFSTDVSQKSHPTPHTAKKLLEEVAFAGFGELGPKGNGPYVRRWTAPFAVRVVGDKFADATPPSAQDKDGEMPYPLRLQARLQKELDVYQDIPNLAPQAVQLISTPDVKEPAQVLLKVNAATGITFIEDTQRHLTPLLSPLGADKKISGMWGGGKMPCWAADIGEARLMRVVVLVRSDIKDYQKERCYREMLTLSLGFGMETNTFLNMFDNGGDGLALSALGQVVAKTLYDDAVRPGMTSAELAVVAPAIIQTHIDALQPPALPSAQRQSE
jgi:hypothetical protein